MNQILSVEPPKEKKAKKERKNRSSEPMDTSKTILIFAIVLIVFGIALSGSASFALYNNKMGKNSNAKPTISVEDSANNQLKVTVTHIKPLEKVQYNWNDEQPTELNANGKKRIDTTIEIPPGENTLNIYAVDKDGNEISYPPKKYTRQGDVEITFDDPADNKVKIELSGKTEEVTYLKYKWDNGEEQIMNVQEGEELAVDITEGQHKLTVTAYDQNDNVVNRKEQEILGLAKPKVDIHGDDSKSHFVINASSSTGISKIEITVDQNDQSKMALDLTKVYPSVDDRKEFDSTQYEKLEELLTLHDGENKLEVNVYTEVNGVTASTNAKVKIVK